MNKNKNLINKISSLFDPDTECDRMEIAKTLAEIEKMKKLSKLKKEYKDKIKRRTNDNRPYVYINRKQIIAPSEEELYKKIYDLLYGIETYTIFQLFPLFIKYKSENTPTKGLTLKKYINDFNKYFLPYEGKDIIDKPFIELTSKDFIRLFNKWCSTKEVNSRLFCNLKTIINGIYKFVITDLGLDTCNRIRDIDMRQFFLKPTKKKDNAFSEEERKKILDELAKNEDPVSLALSFNFYCGLRIGELLALRYSDIENGILSVNGQYLKDISIQDDMSFTPISYKNSDMVKGYTEAGFRKIPLHDNALKIIQKMRKINPFGEYIFMKDGKQLHPNTCGSRIRRLCIKLGLRPRGTHAIRFTFASMLYHNNITALSISKLLGHTSVTMTQRYINDIMPDYQLNELVKEAL